MGEETTEFASRFSLAVEFLRRLSEPGETGRSPGRAGEDVSAMARRALDAIEAVYATDTGAVRRWPEQRRRVLAELASARAALEASGAGEELRRKAHALVRLIDSEPTRSP